MTCTTTDTATPVITQRPTCAFTAPALCGKPATALCYSGAMETLLAYPDVARYEPLCTYHQQTRAYCHNAEALPLDTTNYTWVVAIRPLPVADEAMTDEPVSS